ncbi:unnamed protein product [Pleuronectes platessa]|uniref:Uncharacterized protein n=1 Tax=Pleuronectes platessa TaxID=8262 RepID=A0A9N7TM11_PLEPL|nr:unnamed protein product [Pleuronectes platessa]
MAEYRRPVSPGSWNWPRHGRAPRLALPLPELEFGALESPPRSKRTGVPPPPPPPPPPPSHRRRLRRKKIKLRVPGVSLSNVELIKAHTPRCVPLHYHLRLLRPNEEITPVSTPDWSLLARRDQSPLRRPARGHRGPINALTRLSSSKTCRFLFFCFVRGSRWDGTQQNKEQMIQGIWRI